MKTQTNQEQEGDSKADFDQEVLKLDFNQCPGTPKMYHPGPPESVPPHGLKKP
jgi:hypothetical protein